MKSCEGAYQRKGLVLKFGRPTTWPLRHSLKKLSVSDCIERTSCPDANIRAASGALACRALPKLLAESPSPSRVARVRRRDAAIHPWVRLSRSGQMSCLDYAMQSNSISYCNTRFRWCCTNNIAQDSLESLFGLQEGSSGISLSRDFIKKALSRVLQGISEGADRMYG